MSSANGITGPRMTHRYRPHVHATRGLMRDHLGPWTLADLERMRRDSRIKLGLRTIKAPIHTVKWTVKATDQAVADFVDRTYRRVWKEWLSQLLLMVDYGRSCAEITAAPDPETGLIELQGVWPLYPYDCVPLQLAGNMVGLRVKPVAVDLPAGRYLYLVNEPEFSPWHGRNRVIGAWEPWSEKSQRHGAKDIRRLWFLKNAYRGMRIRHPMGVIQLGDGRVMACEDYAREIVEKAETGGVMALPNIQDEETGNYLWVIEDPQPNGDITGVREYVGDVDVEILEGMEIPPEVLEAQSTGSWAGRTVPFLVFLTGEDQITNTLITGLDRQCVKQLVNVNFGPSARYEIEAETLVPADEGEQQQPAAPEGGLPGGGSLVPYKGKKGGQGVKDLTTGRIQYGQQLSLDRIGTAERYDWVRVVRLSSGAEWTRYEGDRGGKGWKNTATGEIIYGGEKPGGRGEGSDAGGQPRTAHGFDYLGAIDDTEEVEDKPNATIAKVKSILGRLGNWLSRKTDVPGIEQAKMALSSAVGAIKDAQVKLMQISYERYGLTGAVAIFVASRVISSPLYAPAWTAPIPGMAMLAQVPLMGIAEGILQLARGARKVKKAVGLSLEESMEGWTEGDEPLTNEQVEQLGEDLAKKMHAAFFDALEPHKDALASALEGIDSEGEDTEPGAAAGDQLSMVRLALNAGEKYFDKPPKEGGWVFVRDGKFGGHIYRRTGEDKPKPAEPPSDRPAALSPERVQAAGKVIRSAVGTANLASLAKVRQALAGAGLADRAQQDAAINELRKRGVVSASIAEGRHKVSDEEKAAWIKEGDSMLGYLSMRMSLEPPAPLEISDRIRRKVRKLAAKKFPAKLSLEQPSAPPPPALTPESPDVLARLQSGLADLQAKQAEDLARAEAARLQAEQQRERERAALLEAIRQDDAAQLSMERTLSERAALIEAIRTALKTDIADEVARLSHAESPVVSHSFERDREGKISRILATRADGTVSVQTVRRDGDGNILDVQR